METKRKSRTLALAILLLVFVVGIGAGVAGTFAYLKWEHEKQEQRIAKNREKSPVERMEERMTRMLSLTDEQREAMRPELAAFHDQVRSLNRESRIAFRKLFNDHSKTIKTLLTPEQLVIYEEHLKRRAQRNSGPRPPRTNLSDVPRARPSKDAEQAKE